MTKRWLSGALILGGLLALTNAGLQGAKPSNVVSLRVDFRDNETDGLRSDGLLYFNGQSNVRAVLVDNDAGNFVFDTNDNARLDGGRRLALNFPDPSPIPRDVPYLVDVFIGTIGVTGDPALDGNLRTMGLGETLQRRARLGWVDGNDQYSLRWDGPENHGDGFLKFTCTLASLSDSICVEWTVTDGGKAGLYSIATAPSKGKTPAETWIGSYDMPFFATLVKQ